MGFFENVGESKRQFKYFLLTLHAFCCADLYAKSDRSNDLFEVKASIEHPNAKITSTGSVNRGTSHGSDQVSISWVPEEVDEPLSLTIRFPNDGIYPIFYHLMKIKSNPPVLIALGWKSGSGFEEYTAWKITLDEIPQIKAYANISGPRTFPGVLFDSTTGAIAVLRYESGDGSCGGDEDYVSISTQTGIFKNLCKLEDHRKQVSKVGWKYFDDHPFAKDQADKRKTRIIAIIRPDKNGFSASEQ
jgi:hypothetical protein